MNKNIIAENRNAFEQIRNLRTNSYNVGTQGDIQIADTLEHIADRLGQIEYRAYRTYVETVAEECATDVNAVVSHIEPEEFDYDPDETINFDIRFTDVASDSAEARQRVEDHNHLIYGSVWKGMPEDTSEMLVEVDLSQFDTSRGVVRVEHKIVSEWDDSPRSKETDVICKERRVCKTIQFMDGTTETDVYDQVVSVEEIENGRTTEEFAQYRLHVADRVHVEDESLKTGVTVKDEVVGRPKDAIEFSEGVIAGGILCKP